MKLELTDKQVAILSQLLTLKNDAESKANLVIQTLAAGTDIESWEGVELDIEGKSLTFTVADDRKATAVLDSEE